MPFCQQCGTKNADDARFCLVVRGRDRRRGADGRFAPTPPQPPAPPAGPYVGPPPAAPPQVPGSRSRAGTCRSPAAMRRPATRACPSPRRSRRPSRRVLGFFLAGFGAQAFYNGQMKKGLVQLAVVWLLWIVLVTPAAATGNTGFAWMIGLVIGGVAASDGQKTAEKINAGQPVGEFSWFYPGLRFDGPSLPGSRRLPALSGAEGKPAGSIRRVVNSADRRCRLLRRGHRGVARVRPCAARRRDRIRRSQPVENQHVLSQLRRAVRAVRRLLRVVRNALAGVARRSSAVGALVNSAAG